MTHEDAGKYGAKHPAGSASDPAIAAALTERAGDRTITCTVAHDVAAAFKVPPSEIGKTIDLLEYRITRCQLGLFGYSPEKCILKAAERISDELRGRLQAGAADGRISCFSCWQIADDLGLERMGVSAGCEMLGIKIKPCQLGAF